MNLPDLPARQLAAMVAGRQVSAREVLDAHLARIDDANPTVNALVTLTVDEAREAARRADDHAARGGELGSLHGLPVAHKDLFQTRGLRTTWGSPIYADHFPSVDALIVTRARAAGAIAVGKSNTPEFGAGSHTFNAVFGATTNPWDPTRTAGGSSGGAAAALAAGMVPLADGSDLGGSLRNPANFCGVVGLRPSPGRCPNPPSTNPFGTMSVAGPMGRHVDDVALFLGAIAGPDPLDPTSIAEPAAPLGAPCPDRAEILEGLRIAYSPRLGDLPVEAGVAAVIDAAVDALAAAGARVEEADPPLDGADEAFETLRAHQFAMGYGQLYERASEQMKATVRWNIEAGRALSGPEVGRAEYLRGRVFTAMAAFFERHDVLVSVVSQVAPFPLDVEYPTEVAGHPMANYIEWMRSCSRVTVTACPALSIPAGFSPDGLPVGIQLVAPYRAERRLLEIGAAVEAVLGASSERPPLRPVAP